MQIATDIYTPSTYAANPVVFLHGMSLLGIDDPRQINAVEAIAAAGFRVICPELKEIRNLHIEAASVDMFIRFVAKILCEGDLCPGGRLALFAPSFSGAICLRAAAHADLSPHISAVCAIGSLSGIRDSMEYLFISEEADEYAQLVVLANYLGFVKKYAPMAPVFRALAIDNWHASAVANPVMVGAKQTHQAEPTLAKLSVANQKAVERIRHDQGYRKKIFSELYPFMEKELQAYGVLESAGQIIAPTFLLHGSNDNVIPAQESLDLAARLKNVRLVVSPFIGHADTAVSLRLIGDVGRLIAGFAYFFRHAAR